MMHGRLVCLAACAALACAGPGFPGLRRAAIEVKRPAGATPWTHLAVADAPDDFRFVIVSDRTGEARDGVFESAIEKANLLRPAFVVSVGDLIEGYTEDPERLAAEWDELDAIVGRLDAPFFYAAGNHDYSNAVMARDWARRLGPSYYHFRYKDVLFVVLNSEIVSSVARPGEPIAGPDTAAAQLAWLEGVLDGHADARWTFVLVHQPLWDTPGQEQHWEAVEALLGERPYTAFAGHYHRYTKHTRRDRAHITLATTGGVSSLRGIERGEFDHVALVTVGDDGPVIANLMLEGIHDEDVRTAATRTLVGQLDRAVVPEPLLVEGRLFRSGLQRFALRNESDVPITLRARFAASPHFATHPAELERRLEPGASEEASVLLVAHEPTRTAAVTPGLARWTAEAPGARGPVRVESTAWLLPDRAFPLQAARRPVQVDGELSEWGRLRHAMLDWPVLDGGRAEASVRFDLSHDEEFLYLAAEVRDPTPLSSASLTRFEQDALVVEIDARPDPERSRNEGFREAIRGGSLASLLLVWMALEQPAPDAAPSSFLPPAPPGLRRAVRALQGGYALELAVPAAFLDERAGGPWERLRLNLTLQDFAGADGLGHQHPWRPSRFGTTGLAVPGAGTFVRED